MKKGIHPTIYNKCRVRCACGNSFEIISTLKSITLEICSACHPFYTGQQKFVDTEGRIDKFERKRKIMEQKMQKAKSKKQNSNKPADKKSLSLKEMFSQSDNKK